MDKSIVPPCSSTAKVVKAKDEDAVVENVGKQMEDSKLDHQFKEENVPKVFQDLIAKELDSFKEKLEICFNVSNQLCTMQIGNLIVRIEKEKNGWIIYQNKKDSIRSEDPEKSIVDHLWFVLRNLNNNLFDLGMEINQTKNRKSRNLDSKKLNTLLQSMFHSINHQFSVGRFHWLGFNEDTFLSVLKHVKPETLYVIKFDISWKEKGNYQKMEEIVEMDQWKQAERILSPGVTPLKIEDLFRFERFFLERDHISPEDVLLLTEHAFNSTDIKCCTLSSYNKKFDINAIINVLRSQNDGSNITETDPICSLFKYRYLISKSGKLVFLNGYGSLIMIGNFEETAFRTLKE